MSDWNSRGNWWSSNDEQGGWQGRGWRSNSRQHRDQSWNSDKSDAFPPPNDPEAFRRHRKRYPGEPGPERLNAPKEPQGRKAELKSRQPSRSTSDKLVLTPGPGANKDEKGSRADGDGGDALREPIAISKGTDQEASGSGGGDALREATSSGAASSDAPVRRWKRGNDLISAMHSGELLVKFKKEGPTDQDGDYEMRLATVEERTEERPGASPEDASIYNSIASDALLRHHDRAFVITMTPPRKNPFFLSAETHNFDNPAILP